MFSPKRLCRFSLIFCVFILQLCSSCSHPPLLLKPYLAFVADARGQCVAVVNLRDLKLLKMINLGFTPHRLILRPHSHDVYVTSARGQMAVLGFPELRVVGAFKLGHGPVSLAFTPDGRRAYALEGREILVLDCDHRRVTQWFRLHAALSALALAPDGRTLLGEDAGRLVFLSPASGKVLGAVGIGKDPGSMVILPSSRKVFVADRIEETVSAVDISTRQILSHIEIGSPPSLLALKPDGGEVFALSARDSTLTILSASYDSVEQSLPTGENPAAAILSRNSKVLYISNSGDGTVTRIDTQDRAVTGFTRAGLEPGALALTPDARLLVAADWEGASLAVMRAHPLSLLTMVPVGSNPIDVLVPDWLWRNGQGRNDLK